MLTPPYQTTVRGLASYTIPRVDVLGSTTVRSQLPLALPANWPVPNTALGQVAPRSRPCSLAYHETEQPEARRL